MAHYPEKLKALLDTLALADEAERSEILIDYAGTFVPVPDSVAHKPYPVDRKVPYCESEAYVWAMEKQDGTLKFYFAVENPSGISAKALAVILDRTLSGAPPQQVAAVPSDLVSRVFRQNISMGKGMGLTSMVQIVRHLAEQRAQGESAIPHIRT